MYARAKTFEYRKNDRDFRVGDHIQLREWSARTQQYTGRSMNVVVTLIVDDCPGLPEGYVILQTATVIRAVSAADASRIEDLSVGTRVRIIEGPHAKQTGTVCRFRTCQERADWREDCNCEVALDDDWSCHRVFPQGWLEEIKP